MRRRLLTIISTMTVVVAGMTGVSAASTNSVTTTSSPTQLASLPQTLTEPSLGAPLTTLADSLFADIATNNVAGAERLFLPLPIFLRIKQEPNPSGDWRARLLRWFTNDLVVYHHFLFAQGTPRLLRVTTSSRDASVIQPGWCYNKAPYWHLRGVRFVFESGGVIHSVAICSLVSWRGQWYVVHLGPDTRSSDAGALYAPASGAGTPGPPGSC
jgi:hypothetical protein